MSEEKKDINVDEIMEAVRSENKNSTWGDSWLIVFAFLAFFGAFSNQDTKDHELRERVARLEGQMDMIRG